MDDPGAEELAELAGGLLRPLRTGAQAEAHERPWRGPTGRALAVALPGDVEEVRHVVGWARRHRVRLLPQGAVSGLVGASTPPPDGPRPLVVSTDALVGVLEVDPVAATAVVSAGVRLSALNAAAAVHGLELPVDLAADPSLGGMVATDTGGSRVLRHGSMGAAVLGLQAVVADEDVSVIGSLRGLRKDSTGPDPTRLLIGSAGALGIVTAVCVGLQPSPTERVTALVGPLEDAAALTLLTHLRRRLGDRLSAFEVMCPAAVAAGRAHMADPPPLATGHEPEVTVLIECSGGTGGEELLVDAVSSAPGTDPSSAHLVPATVAWALRHAVTPGLRTRGEVIGLDLSAPPARLPELRAGVRSLVAATHRRVQVVDFGHWGDGGIHCNLVVPPGDALGPAERDGLRESVYRFVVDDLGGSYSAEHGIGPVNARWWRERTDERRRAMVQAVKEVVDPLGVLGHPGIPFA